MGGVRQALLPELVKGQLAAGHVTRRIGGVQLAQNTVRLGPTIAPLPSWRSAARPRRGAARRGTWRSRLSGLNGSVD